MAGEIVFWGASGHAKVLAECTARLGYSLVALFDNRNDVHAPIAGVPVLTGWDGFDGWRRAHPGPCSFLCAIGGDRGPDRVTIDERLTAAGLTAVSVIHPSAFVAGNAILQPGCQVLALAAVGVDVRLGRQSIINTNASVDHDCLLGEGTHVGPGATLAGCVEIGAYTLIGAGAVVLPRIKVGRAAIVGAGAVVVDDVPDGVTVVGNPARAIRVRAA
ncbi:MAG: acetyltransferase [Candidatus Dormibacteraeota bacterium]|nr:acetyltransferase [Candidatus Dormibacteraeota bacterium]